MVAAGSGEASVEVDEPQPRRETALEKRSFQIPRDIVPRHKSLDNPLGRFKPLFGNSLLSLSLMRVLDVIPENRHGLILVFRMPLKCALQIREHLEHLIVQIPVSQGFQLDAQA